MPRSWAQAFPLTSISGIWWLPTTLPDSVFATETCDLRTGAITISVQLEVRRCWRRKIERSEIVFLSVVKRVGFFLATQNSGLVLGRSLRGSPSVDFVI